MGKVDKKDEKGEGEGTKGEGTKGERGRDQNSFLIFAMMLTSKARTATRLFPAALICGKRIPLYVFYTAGLNIQARIVCLSRNPLASGTVGRHHQFPGFEDKVT